MCIPRDGVEAYITAERTEPRRDLFKGMPSLSCLLFLADEGSDLFAVPSLSPHSHLVPAPQPVGTDP